MSFFPVLMRATCRSFGDQKGRWVGRVESKRRLPFGFGTPQEKKEPDLAKLAKASYLDCHEPA